MSELCDIGVFGLAVMGENLALNFESRHWSVCVYNRTNAKTETFMQCRAANLRITPAYDLERFVRAIAAPRKIILMVRAGEAVDSCIDALKGLLSPGDMLIDGGNSHYTDTIARAEALKEMHIRYCDCGISGGAEGALRGASIMVGGTSDMWPYLKPILSSAAAVDFSHAPCCAFMGGVGAGHFVKMVHNGIEYADMQLIAESYWIMKYCAGLNNAECASVFEKFNHGVLDSFLIGITADILRYKEPGNANELIDSILDCAGQKGTGKWTVQAAMEQTVAVPALADALFARSLSAKKELRLKAAETYKDAQSKPQFPRNLECIAVLEKALYAAKIMAYAQGFDLLRTAAANNHWNYTLSAISRVWQGGCIIRAKVLDRFATLYDAHPDLPHLLLAHEIVAIMKEALPALRTIVARCAQNGIPAPSFAGSLSYFDTLISAQLPANLIQAQRDYFGAHTYERVDHARGEFFHSDWMGLGSASASETYNA